MKDKKVIMLSVGAVLALIGVWYVAKERGRRAVIRGEARKKFRGQAAS